MGWFSRKISDPEEAFARLISPDAKTSQGAVEDFVANLNHSFIQFLVEKFQEENTHENRLKILEIFAARHASLSSEDLRVILKLITYPDTIFRETFKEILQSVSEDKLRPLSEILCSTSDTAIRATLQHAIERAGLLDRLLNKWKDYSTKDKILYLQELVLIQNPKIYPIFLDIMREELSEGKREEKKIIQVEFGKHIEKIKDPEFMETCLRELSNIDQSMWYPVFKCLQFHGDAFFSRLFTDLDRKPENLRLRVMQLLAQLSDPLSFPYLFPYLLDRAKSITPVVRDAIQDIVKRVADQLDELHPEALNSKEVDDKLQFFLGPLVNCLKEDYSSVIQIICECILRLGRYRQDIILNNFPLLFKFNESYLNSFLRGLNVTDRKILLIEACCFGNVETGRTAITLLSNPTENYIIETLNSLLLDHFMRVPPPIQGEIINLMMNPRLKRFVEEVLYHKDPELRARILQVLGESGSPNVLPIFQSKLRDPQYSVRKSILNILQTPAYETPEGTALVLEFLKDSDHRVVLDAIEVLKHRDHTAILPNLTKLLATKDPQIQDAAHQAIAFVTRRKYMTGFDKMSNVTREAIGKSLVKMDPTFLEDITRNLSASDQRDRVLAAMILEVLFEEIPPELKTNLIVAIQDPDPHVRALVIRYLGKIGGPSVANMLVEFLRDQDDRVRANAVEAMAAVGDISLVEHIVPLLYDSNNRVRANTITTLWGLGYYQIFEAVTDMLRSPDKWMRASAAFALGELKDARFCGILLQCIRDAEPEVRRNVIRSLGKITEPLTLAPYIRPLRFDPDEGVRNAVSEILTAAQSTK